VAQNLKLITPITAFQDKPTINNYLVMSEYLVEEGYERLDTEIENFLINTNIDIALEAEGQKQYSFHEFDLAVWRLLKKIDTSIDWWKYLEEDDPESTKDSTQKSKIKSTPSELTLAVADTIRSHEEDVAKNKKSWNGYLYFFSQVNEKIKDRQNLKHCLEISKELSLYLYQINIYPFSKPHKTRFPDQFWKWFIPKTISLYAKFFHTDEYVIKSLQIANQVNQIRILSSCVLLCWVCQNKDYETSSIKKAIEHINIDSNSLVPHAFRSSEFMGMIKELLFRPTLTRTEMELKEPFLSMLLLTLHSGKFINQDVYAVLIYSMFDQGLDVSDIFDEDISNLLNGMLCSLYPSEGNLFWPIDFDWALLDDPIIDQYRKVHELDGPSIETAFEILNTRYLFPMKSDGYYSDLARDLVAKCKRHHKETGNPFNLGLELDEHIEFDLYPAFPEYHESISTLPILLGQTDNYLNTIDVENYTERLIKGAEVIADAGLIKHALVFLGYGLIKTALGVTYQTDFSIRDVNAFIYRADISPFIEKYFFPFLEFYLETDFEPPLGVETWIKSVLSGTKNNHLSIVDSKSNNVISINYGFSFPEWHDKSNESLVKAIEHYKDLKKNNQLENSNAWRIAYTNEKIEFTLITLTQCHERVIRDLFGEIICFINENENLKLKFNELDPQFRFEDSLGGIGKFISLIQDQKNRNTQKIKNLIKAFNDSDSEHKFGKILVKINRSGEDVYSSFQTYWRLDNRLSHRGRQPEYFSKGDADWLFSYITRDFSVLYQCFK